MIIRKYLLLHVWLIRTLNLKLSLIPVNFIANSNSTVNISDYDNVVINFNNPFKDFLTFSEIKNFKKITILNLNGIPILESYSRTIDTSKISPGIYFILLESDGYQRVYKSVKI